jgi:hypothetical protein
VYQATPSVVASTENTTFALPSVVVRTLVSKPSEQKHVCHHPITTKAGCSKCLVSQRTYSGEPIYKGNISRNYKNMRYVYCILYLTYLEFEHVANDRSYLCEAGNADYFLRIDWKRKTNGKEIFGASQVVKQIIG